MKLPPGLAAFEVIPVNPFEDDFKVDFEVVEAVVVVVAEL